MIPETTVQALAERLKTDKSFVLLDVREPWEIELAHLTDRRVIVLPMSQIAQQYLQAFPPEMRDPQTRIVVMCHHGVRSANVTAWMRSNGWNNVVSLAGGIAAYAEQVDASIGFY